MAAAAEACLLAAVAEAEQHGRRVWWAAYEPRPVPTAEAVYAWFMALDDDDWEFEFALRYNGDADDLVPEGCDDFTVFVAGGKGSVSDLYPSGDPAEPDEPRPGLGLHTEDGRPLRFVLRLPQREPGPDWSSLPGVHLRCNQDEVLVDVDDPDQECFCGQISRDTEGRLLPCTPYAFVAVYEPVPEEA
ncbi:hypothetical protein [Streptacidiphilus sp. P02-A3a]|uniref:hypothetical protein n=1 Tax=Streptacidiphilus sp. P02-A3a TaxID=2704468 RepID=UPI0015F80250|nr:hypothetical protein [Streptacidiphilus sp. P02-A3a]QMU71421.1 hypothetical protein GXP74_27495 [Streptacidiphilus sp. P02-A3a]